MPTTTLPVGKIRVLIVDSDSNAASALADTLQTQADYEVQTVHSNFETGVIAQKFAPHVLLINLLDDGVAANEICKNIRGSEDLQTIKIIALANQLTRPEAAALLQKGFDAYVSDSTDVTEVIKKIEQTTAIIY